MQAFLTTCPTALHRSPAVVEAWRCWRWWDKGGLAARFPDGIPLMLARAVEEMDAGYSRGVHDRPKPKAGGNDGVKF